MSAKFPVTNGRMASRTKTPAVAWVGTVSAWMAKWLDQNQTRRSRNGVAVVTAFARYAWTSF